MTGKPREPSAPGKFNGQVAELVSSRRQEAILRCPWLLQDRYGMRLALVGALARSAASDWQIVRLAGCGL